VNLAATWQLAKANRQSMNIEGSFQHILTDLIAFIVTAIAGVVILATGWTRAYGVAALVIAGVMFRSAWGLLRDSGRVLLEAAPEGMDAEAIGRAIATYPHVESVRDPAGASTSRAPLAPLRRRLARRPRHRISGGDRRCARGRSRSP
jgi:cobalt-zinc-cadmium efflux system protein